MKSEILNELLLIFLFIDIILNGYIIIHFKKLRGGNK